MKKNLISILLIGLTALLSMTASTRPAPQPVVVLELFTSQGCSSCPPADQVLRELTQQDSYAGRKVYGLSFHVDYWNRLGWQDPFSARAFTDRQRAYDRRLKTQTYTPQLIINGRQDVIGGQKGRVLQLIQQQSASSLVEITGKAAYSSDKVAVTYALSEAGPYQVNAALIQQEAQTAVRAGENGGRTLQNVNVVRQFTSVTPNGTSGSLTLPIPAGLTSQQTALLLYVQRTDNLQIIGAKQL
ncbi:DUF1223 domain-containing protein [Spirosoma sp. KUDC1026]|uniref:DUF1223 domain-containing protein n=1 Tax=Spirosoma sp. KUDC1026 TaxID=2745947 RepID=UPI00159BD541|nr:DUF1223 domain-containing protein [Spirosoma sp. KUDC1026]QKZ11359.1 DUF1223 domain-containing protein [Spirosoma sp. KUDC1026]